ncbi:hypothetical protein GF367_02900 [Candidatus Woesearchaeota archaeon]|nr:hypothetical protein [Candidatus Woesearchaeota archaeon]
MRRAQIEIMGLVMVVVLVTIGIFFSVALKKPTPDRTPLEVYGNEKLANNFLITLLESQTACGPKVRDVAVDCVRDAQTGQTGRYACDGKQSCDYLATIANHTLDKTLKRWNYRYNLTFTYTAGDTIQLFSPLTNGDCTPQQKQTAPGIQPISLFRVAPGKAMLTLRICD